MDPEAPNQSPPSQTMESPPPSPADQVSSSSNSTSEMSVEEKFRIVRSVGEECIQEDELMNLLSKKPLPVCYDGFEPSGRMHIAQGVMKIINVNKLTSAGCKVKIWIADWFAQLNNKMGGDLKKIQTVGQYMIEIWKAVGLNLQGDKVEFLWSSEEINSRSHEYWPLVMDIARRNKLPRIMRCVQIMGRSEQDELTAAQILYPCMQCADIFFLKADICQLGMDQRKVNVLAREYCDDIKRKNKPIILSHHMLPGLQQGQEKMSKSDPSSSIFMEDEEAEVNLKIKKAYCPPMIVAGNPCLEYIKFIIFPWFHEFKVERNADNGGEKTFSCFEELVADYESGNLHPADLKPALSKAINKILQVFSLFLLSLSLSSVSCDSCYQFWCFGAHSGLGSDAALNLGLFVAPIKKFLLLLSLCYTAFVFVQL
ncbi:Tyrosine--tRNA ligase like [Actinidia chinensis var. chinensis]|uniref:tyrosine--tRNA ligase n=1 Tax=Actinidia chinensis var. chinensis TaxID=1590841 RepID=A0A2R6PTU9_ACTCC|nr:Tyrosine--tRNA ligase like [Actinidia chinensis var. chinensis]